MKSVKFNPLTSLVMAAALAIGLSACGGGGGERSEAERLAEQRAEEQAACESAGGRWEADYSCTSATELVAEASQMTCERCRRSVGMPTTRAPAAADVAAEQLGRRPDASCTDAGGRWEANNTCTDAAALAAEMPKRRTAGRDLQMVCTDAGGRWESDNTCTSAADVAAEMERERLAAARRWTAPAPVVVGSPTTTRARVPTRLRWNGWRPEECVLHRCRWSLE